MTVHDTQYGMPLSAHHFAGGPGAQIVTTLSNGRNRRAYLPKALEPQLTGCRLVLIKAAAPNHIQASHLGSWSGASSWQIHDTIIVYTKVFDVHILASG
jgi:hypothetical protein